MKITSTKFASIYLQYLSANAAMVAWDGRTNAFFIKQRGRRIKKSITSQNIK